MSAPFSISEFATGGDSHLEKISDSTADWLKARKDLGAIVIIIAVVCILYCIHLLWKKYVKEGMSPMATMRLVEQDTQSVGATAQETKPEWAREHAVAAPMAAAPGTLAYQVLNSSEFDCANRKASPDDAWAWMSGVARQPGENMEEAPTDNLFSQIASGNK